jgi:hypothetical protein
MSEYQYYQFQAIDRPLTAVEQQELRALSTRARITATSFVNSYEWGDFKGSPSRLIERYFDLHLYLANWGSRHFFMRLPKKLVDRQLLEAFLGEVDCAEIRDSGPDLIVEICRDELDVEDFDDGSGWLAALAPLRADILAGDLRMFYLLWLTAVEAGVFELDEPEPMPGLGPMNARLNAFAEFFQIDGDLVAAAAERNADPIAAELSARAVDAAIRSLPETERASYLSQLYGGDPHVGAQLRRRLRESHAAKSATKPIEARTVGELRARAASIAQDRERAADAVAKAERERREKEQAEARKKRLVALAQRGEYAWREVEAEISRRNAPAYDKAAALLADLRDVAAAQGNSDDFQRRLEDIRRKHAQKGKFIERLRALDQPQDQR